MKHILIALLALFCATINAQNQVVKRQAAETGTRASSTKNKRSSKPKKNSAAENLQTHRINVSYSNGVLTVSGVRYEFVRVSPGTFIMGATSEMKTPYGNEKPTHIVTLTNDYYIGKTEVTQALWQAIMDGNPSYFKSDNLPVESVSWNDCQEFIDKLNHIIGKNFRMPTEAEWEYAARGGNKSRGYQYSGSNNLSDVAWYDGDKTHPVETKQPNELGIYDMSGNVREWCQDWYGIYSSSSQTNPQGPISGVNRISRGGSWFDGARCHSSQRDGNESTSVRNNITGLRLCLSE